MVQPTLISEDRAAHSPGDAVQAPIPFDEKRLSSWAYPAVILLACLAIYGQAVRFSFVEWDDLIMVAHNPYLNPPSLAHTEHFWRRGYDGLYAPLLYTLYALLARLTGGPNPAIFHAASVLLHGACSVAVFALLRGLKFDRDGALLGALLFAVHPVQVEAIAWVGGMDTPLCVLFCLLSLLHYVRYRQNPAGRSGHGRSVHYAAASGFFVAALFAKPSAVCLPVVAAAIDFALLRQPEATSNRKLLPSAARCALPVLPWLALAAFWVHITQTAQVVVDDASHTWLQRLLVAGDSLSFYFAKIFVPIHLAVDYGRTPLMALHHTWIYVTAACGALSIAAAWWFGRRRPVIAVGFALFVAALLPVLGLVPFAYQAYSTVADRYMYLAMLGPAVALAGSIKSWPKQALGAACGVLAVFAVLSGLQTRCWRSSKSLFSHSLAISPDCPNIHYAFGQILQREGPRREAVRHFQIALDLVARSPYSSPNPKYAPVYCDMAQSQSQLGNAGEAVFDYEEAERLNPDLPRPYNELGLVFALQGKPADAAAQWQKAVSLVPGNAAAHYDLGCALLNTGRIGEAEGQIRDALSLQPGMESARHLLNLAQSAARAAKDR